MKKLFKKIKNNRGETLIEVVVSCAIFAIIAVSLMSLILGAAGIGKKATGIAKADLTTLERLETGNNTTSLNETVDGAKNIAGTFKSAGSAGTAGTFTIKSGGTYQKAVAGESALPLSEFKSAEIKVTP